MAGSKLRRRGAGKGLDELIDALERAGLHGHGGAFFPTATKLRAVAAQRGCPVVVVNGSEGEPLSRKDRYLLGARTEWVLDGAFAAAVALGADTIVIAVDHRRVRTIETLQTVLAERPASDARPAPAVEILAVPDGFITGQETALVNYLNGREAKPTLTPPYPFEKGVRGRPTLVSNVETYAHIGRVLDGSYDGGRFLTVSGAVPKTAVVHVQPQTTVAAAIAAAGGSVERPTAVLLGGYGGTWAAMPDALELRLDEPALRARGLTLGAGIVHVLGESRCGVSEVARVTRWMATQTAGQCGPCVFGLAAIADALDGLCGRGDAEANGFTSLSQLQRWCAMVDKRGGCAHPDGVSRYVTSALTVMNAEFSDHALHGPCARCDVTASAPRRHGVSSHRPTDRGRAIAR